MVANFQLETETAKMPTRHTDKSAGIDFYADSATVIEPGGSAVVSTGISWHPKMIPIGSSVVLIIQSRSGLAFKRGVEASNAGVIDSDYFSTEEVKAIIKVKLYNNSREIFTVSRGDKICQGVPHLVPNFLDVKTLDDDRAGKGFGSSDKKG